jgi:hypothetical protein
MNTKSTKHKGRRRERHTNASLRAIRSFGSSCSLSDLRVSKLLELNLHDNQGVRFLLHDLDDGLSWEESVARDEERTRMLEGRNDRL